MAAMGAQTVIDDITQTLTTVAVVLGVVFIGIVGALCYDIRKARKVSREYWSQFP